jgi:hypothetical protein
VFLSFGWLVGFYYIFVVDRNKIQKLTRNSEILNAELMRKPTPEIKTIVKYPTIVANSTSAIGTIQKKPAFLNNQDPAYAPLLRKQLLRNIRRTYLGGLAKLNLPREQRIKLEDLLLAREQASADAAAAAANFGISDSREAAAASFAAQNEVSKEIQDLIGASGVAVLDQASSLYAQKTILETGVGVDLQADGIPLTSEQENDLALLIYNTSRSDTNPNYQSLAAQPIDPQTGLSAIDLSILDQASQFLSPSQIAILREYQQEQMARTEYFAHKSP